MAAAQRFYFNSSSLRPAESFRAESSRWSRLTAKASGNDQNDSNSDENGSSTSTDWDKAWSTYKNRAQKRPLFDLNMEQYVTRQPVHRNFPISEEVDELHKAERATLDAWTNPKLTYAGFSVIFGLFVYMVINIPS